MNDDDVKRLMAYLKANGAWIELNDDALDVWRFALRSFTPQMVKAGVMWFLERNHPREVSPATIKAAVKSLMASGTFREPMCPDHHEEVARWCRCCRADVHAGHRPLELVGKALTPGRVLTTRPGAMAELNRVGVMP